MNSRTLKRVRLTIGLAIATTLCTLCMVTPQSVRADDCMAGLQACMNGCGGDYNCQWACAQGYCACTGGCGYE